MEECLNQDFSTLVNWFVGNKLSIHFGEDKTKFILFSPKHKSKSIGQIKRPKCKQCLSTTSIFKFFSEMCPQYMNEISKTTNQKNTVTINSSLKLFQPLRTTLTKKFVRFYHEVAVC